MVDRLNNDVARLAVSYQRQPLSQFLGQLVETQNALFALLEGRLPAHYVRRLMMLASITSGLLAKVAHDQGAGPAALGQCRTAYLCADNSDHSGMRAWIRGLQSLITYWQGRYHESVRYAQQGTQYGTLGSTRVWLPVNEARAWAALGNAPATHDALRRAEEARDRIQPDDVDEMGGACTFSRARQLYYAAEALAWLPSEAAAAERYALQAHEAYADSDSPDWSFSDQAGAATDLAVARVRRGEVEGAAEALQPVLGLPPEQRIQGVMISVQRVYSSLSALHGSAIARSLQEQIEVFTATPLAALPG